MKYIRTKYGIFKRYKNSTIIDNIFYYPDDGMLPEYRREPILKQADTIKELCDEFVIIGYKIKDPFIFSKEGISIDDFWKHSPSDTIVYGAIWTEWGLKYVAKMNDKGELELL